MLDPLPPPPAWLRDFIEPWALSFNLPALPDHIHEVLLAFAGYQFIHSVLSPWLSARLFPNHYPKFNKRTKLNWDVHVVSFIQSCLINSVALWVIFFDEERGSMGPGERVFGYTGACCLLGSLAMGYFIYDLIVSTVYIKIFGVGMLFHGMSALWVFSFGFRPFVNFYSPVFILYELSSPFLNIHWFLDKLNLTGSKYQWYNGMLLLFTFFSCRLIWGTYQSGCVYVDMYRALKQTWDASSSDSSLLNPVDITTEVFQLRDGSLCVNETCAKAGAEVSKFSSFTAGGVPTWLVLTYVVSNVILNSLNYYWFSKMIETVLKRFRTPEDKKKQDDPAKKAVLDGAAKLEEEESLRDSHAHKNATGADVSANDVKRRKA